MKTIKFIFSLLFIIAATSLSVRAQNNLNHPPPPLMILDNMQIDSVELSLIDPDDIAAIEILRDTNLLRPYGAPGKNGVVRIYSIEYAAKKYKTILSAVSETYKTRMTEVRTDTGFLYILRDKPLLNNPAGSLIYLNQDSIRSVEFIDRESCLKVYGATKSMGCIEIKMK
jgi:hypothetical protein